MPSVDGYPRASSDLCFLDLPYGIRRRIYIFSGLVRVCPINLNNEGRDKSGYMEDCLEWSRRQYWSGTTYNMHRQGKDLNRLHVFLSAQTFHGPPDKSE